MEKILTISFLLFAFLSNAQKTMFGAQNNYVAPVTPPSLVTNGLLLYLNAILDYPFSDYKKTHELKIH